MPFIYFPCASEVNTTSDNLRVFPLDSLDNTPAILLRENWAIQRIPLLIGPSDKSCTCFENILDDQPRPQNPYKVSQTTFNRLLTNILME